MIETILNGIRLHEKLSSLLFHIEAAGCVAIDVIIVIVINVVTVVGFAGVIAICRIDRLIFYFWAGAVALFRVYR